MHTKMRSIRELSGSFLFFFFFKSLPIIIIIIITTTVSTTVGMVSVFVTSILFLCVFFFHYRFRLLVTVLMPLIIRVFIIMVPAHRCYRKNRPTLLCTK